MTRLLKIAVKNANGLCQHAQEIKLFIQTFHVDILLVEETHFTARSYIKIPNYTIYYIPHPDETAHGGTAVIIRQNIKHHVREGYKQDNLQATSISLEDNIGETTISAIYVRYRTPLHSTTISTKIMIDSLRNLDTASLSEETTTPNTPPGDPDSRIRKEGSHLKLCKIIT
jgi:exonuclease III